MDTPNNPLLDFSRLPRFRDIRPDHVKPALDFVLADNLRRREERLARGTRYSWNDFVQPLEDMNERLARMWSPVSHLNSVMNNDALRAAYNDNLPRLSEYYTDLAQDERLYAAYKQVAAAPEYAAYSPAQKKIVDNVLRDFRLAGAELPPENKARFKEIQKELSTLTSRYSDNVLDATEAWELSVTNEADLAGLPESARAQARQSARTKDRPGWRFTLEAPSYIAIMTYADKRELRRQMYQAYVTRASECGPNAGKWDNGPIMQRILALRSESAKLLGYPDYAHYALQTRMATSVEQVLGFLNDLALRARPAARAELEELRVFARDTYAVSGLEAFDIAYYAERLRETRYAISQEQLRPYFPETRVVPGMFDVVRRLYGVSIVAAPDVETWHPDVRVYEIRDENETVRGRFYLDLYARPNKRGGAWMDDCVPRRRDASGVQIPVAYLTCNFAPPVDGKPALLTHEDVETLFHEFGHGLHHMLTLVDHVGVAGINGVAWDAVELPSQFMENWCWEREALDVFAAHYETGARLPEDMWRKTRSAKNFQSGMQCLRQIEFSLFDMRVHGQFDVHDEHGVQALLDAVRREVAVVIPPAFNRFQNSFSHIFAGGYAAGYYSYKWAEVLSADAFSKFEERGIFDRTTGLEFLHNILEQGGAREPMELFVRFRGREPRIDALLRHSGLVV